MNTFDHLLLEAITWMSAEFSRQLDLRVEVPECNRPASRSSNPSSRARALGKKVKLIEILERLKPGKCDQRPDQTTGPERVRVSSGATRRSLNSDDVRREAKKLPEPESDQASGDVAQVAVRICSARGRSRAGALAQAWLCRGDFRLEDDVSEWEAVVGVAAVAAVWATVIVLRRGESVSTRRGKLAPSADFETLCQVASCGGEIGGVAETLRKAVETPWCWRIDDAVCTIGVEALRSLLAAFAEHDSSGIQRFQPKAGDRFDRDKMAHAPTPNPDDEWVVAADTPLQCAGFARKGIVLCHADVSIETSDWHVVASPGCAVGQDIRRRPDEYILGGEAQAARWRAPWGIAHPEDFRERFDERTLATWQERVVTELAVYYPDRPERCPCITGIVGHPYELSTMEQVGDETIGDAVVAEVVERNDVPQHGLACPGGSALLFAVVRTQAAGSKI